MTGLDNESRPGAEVVLVDVGGVCGHDFLAAEADVPLTWSLWNSFFFTFTVITTIGKCGSRGQGGGEEGTGSGVRGEIGDGFRGSF